MTDEFWTPEDAAEFAQVERDDAAASQAAEDQFPAGWTEVGATEKQAISDMTIGPGRIFTAPVASSVFDAIDPVSSDRTLMASWVEVYNAIRDYQGIDDRDPAPAPRWITDAIDRASTDQTLTVETKFQPGSYDKLIELLQGTADAMQELGRAAHSVALMGTGYRRHASPGKRRSGETRAAHARRRRLYSARLRRDRRRRRAGRAPILCSSAFEMLIPRAQVDVRKTGPEYAGMEAVLSPMVPEDQVYIVDNSVLRNHMFVEPHQLDVPKMFDLDRATWRSQVLYGMGAVSLTGRHRATNFLIQADNSARRDLGLPLIEYIERGTGERKGWSPSRVWVDDVEVDVDTWMNEGGADHG